LSQILSQVIMPR